MGSELYWLPLEKENTAVVFERTQVGVPVFDQENWSNSFSHSLDKNPKSLLTWSLFPHEWDSLYLFTWGEFFSLQL